jgi:hypothetical protein
MSVGQMSFGQMSVGQMSFGQMSVGQMYFGQMSVVEMEFEQKACFQLTPGTTQPSTTTCNDPSFDRCLCFQRFFIFFNDAPVQEIRQSVSH